MLEYFEREQLPGDVKGTLASALNGDLHLQALLFNAMIDTWPKLQANIAEIQRRAATAPWKIHPFAKRGEKATPKAEKKAKEVETYVWGMKPRAQRRELGFEGTVKALVLGYYYGHAASEIRWEKGPEGWHPRCTKAVPARFYGYPYDALPNGDDEDRLMFDPDGGTGMRRFQDFPENRFLIAIHGVHAGHPAVAAPLRALAGYWLAAVYGLKWFLNFTQLYGIPWRHAEVGDLATDRNIVEKALAEIGSKGYIVTKTGTKINVLDGSKSGSALPQKALIDLADDQCDIFILGQTLTSGTDDSGSRALGEVHSETLDKVVDGVVDFVGEVMTYQFVPAIVAANWGDDQSDMPELWGKREKPKDSKAAGEKLESAKRLGMAVGRDYGYEEMGIPVPAEGEDLLFDPAAEPDIVTDPGDVLDPGEKRPGQPAKPDGTKVPAGVPGKKKTVEAADASLTWRLFPAGSGSLGIPRAEMPQIASSNRGAMVSFMRARGIESQAEQSVQADTLKPTQAEYSPDKVMQAMAYKGGNRAILVSEDGHVVDGHHQWQAAVNNVEPIRIIRLMAPIHRVLMMAHRMPSTTVAASLREDLDDGSSDSKLGSIMRSMKQVLESPLLNEDELSAILGAAWVSGATEEP